MVNQNERYESPKQGRDTRYVYRGLECVFGIRELEERGIDCEENFHIGNFYFQPIKKLIKCRVLEREIATEVPDNEAFEKGGFYEEQWNHD